MFQIVLQELDGAASSKEDLDVLHCALCCWLGV
jgi:hypothetical protein